MCDVAIIGAGPAGCVAAIVLARGGWDVSLVEQHRFPRDKVCGECLSALGIETLERLRVAPIVRGLEPVVLRKSCLIARDGSKATVALPREMWGLTRVAMDTALLEQARHAGAKIVQPARCERVALEPLAITVRHLDSNDIETIEAAYVLAADGKASLGFTAPPLTGDLGVKAHFRGVDEANETISLFGVDGHYVGLAPVEGGRWNVAMSVPATRVKVFGGDFDRLFEQMMRENAGLARAFARAAPVDAWLASPLPRFAVNRRWPKRVVPIGNAAAALEPIGGEGMGLAMRSGELAAEAVDAALRRGVDVDQKSLHRRYERLWRSRRAAARAAGMIMSDARLARMAVATLDLDRRLATPALSLLGKR